MFEFFPCTIFEDANLLAFTQVWIYSVASRGRLTSTRACIWLANRMGRRHRRKWRHGTVRRASLGVYRSRPFAACCHQEVEGDLHGPTAAEPSHGALVSAPVVAAEAHGLFTRQHLQVHVARFLPAAAPVETEPRCCRAAAAATTCPGPELRGICSWQLLRRPRRDGEALDCLP